VDHAFVAGPVRPVHPTLEYLAGGRQREGGGETPVVTDENGRPNRPHEIQPQ
jgi:hypothetical protein